MCVTALLTVHRRHAAPAVLSAAAAPYCAQHQQGGQTQLHRTASLDQLANALSLVAAALPLLLLQRCHQVLLLQLRSSRRSEARSALHCEGGTLCAVQGLAVSAHHRVRLSETSSLLQDGLLGLCVSEAAGLAQSALRSARAVLLLLLWLLVGLLRLFM
jgi:hypothetical protein